MKRQILLTYAESVCNMKKRTHIKKDDAEEVREEE